MFHSNSKMFLSINSISTAAWNAKHGSLGLHQIALKQRKSQICCMLWGEACLINAEQIHQMDGRTGRRRGDPCMQ